MNNINRKSIKMDDPIKPFAPQTIGIRMFLIAIVCVILDLPLKGQFDGVVKVWEDTLTLPTYLIHPPDINPMFFRNQSYQGASRVVYPYPLQDNFSTEKKNVIYKAFYLENKYIKLCVLPEIGGRLFYATDKTNDYEIFYRQHVIKPAKRRKLKRLQQVCLPSIHSISGD